MELLKQLINIQLTPDEMIFTGKWLISVPLILWTVWVHWRAMKSFAGTKK